MVRLFSILVLLVFAVPAYAGDNLSSVFAGDWRGVGIQSDGSDWLIQLSLEPGGAAVDYPEFPCGGRWESAEETSSHFAATEQLEYGQKICIDNSPVRLSRLSASQLLAVWLDENGAEIAIAVLHRNNPDLNDRAGEFSETSLTGMIRNLGLGPRSGCAIPMA